MQWRNSPQRYGSLSVLIHWSVAITVYGMFALGLWMVTLSYYSDWYHKAPDLHKSIGITLMMVMVIRVIWRFISPPPPSLKSYSPLTRIAAVTAHVLLYVLLFSILLSGYFISTADGKGISLFGFAEIPALLSDGATQADFAGDIHLWLAWSLVIISLLHGLAALKHHFIDKDATLKRMLGKASN
ncbi:cytochrome b [Citrobacter sp. JGM124]|uniref:cytochrome b n=1 Tax=Citrobacter sp. JGM124 TaxID=2799789 RepID=UPI001BACD22A|nr:cytochrome b [Citrobacter sp. JGM124]MBS0847667.1 cytochrome b [Citrobacter sp. JGM124]